MEKELKNQIREKIRDFVFSLIILVSLIALLILIFGCAGRPQLVIHDYSTRVEVQQAVQEQSTRARPDQPRVYGPGVFDDPTVVAFKNLSDYITYEIFVDDEKQGIVLLPRHTSPILFLPVGTHSVVAKGRRPTLQFGEIHLPDRVFPVMVRPRGRAQIIGLF